MSFSNLNILIKIGKCRNIAFDVNNWVEIVKTLGGGELSQGGELMHDTCILYNS